MLRAIVEFSLRFRGVVVSVSCLVLAYGVYVADQAKLDVFPDFVPPQVTVQTEAPGLAAEQVEALVTRPIESAINGLGSQESLRSESSQGLSVITVVFKEGTDVLPARQQLAERLGEIAGNLPAGVKTPKVSPLVSATMDLLKIGLVSDRLSPMELRTFADWTLKPRLLSVPGVARCNVFGGEVRQWQIQVLPEQLLAHNVSLEDVLGAARLASGVRGAGFVETENQRISIQSEGQTLTAEALGNVVVAAGAGGVPLRLRDVARVVEGAEPKFGDALIMGRPGLALTLSSQAGANTMEVTRALEAALDDLKPLLLQEGITLYPAMHRPASFIESSLTNIRHSLLLGAVLVSVVLLLFLGHFRTALISLTAIPLSLLTAIVVLDRLGVTLNTITLGGLAIALGEVVDDAIIDVENILRRLRENVASAAPRPVVTVILDASLEVRNAVVFATFVVALVFLPVLTLSGLQGSFFAPLALSYLLAILASLVVALTLTPALAVLLFGRTSGSGPDAPRLQIRLRNGYERVLRGVTRHSTIVVSVVAVLCVFALSRLPFLGGEFLPEFREGHFVVGVTTAPGTSLPEMLRVGGQISGELLKNKRIATVEEQIGRAEQGEDPWGPHRAEFHVELQPHLSGRDMEAVENEIRDVFRATPGMQAEVMTFLGDRIGETISGETSPVVVNLFGDDLDALDAKADEVAQVLGTIRGAAGIQAKSSGSLPRISVRLRAEKLTQLGFRPVEVLDAVQTAYEGTVVAQVYRESQVSDIVVVLDPASRRDPEEVGALSLSNPAGRRVRLSDIADVSLSSGRFSILHDGGRRRQVVTCTPVGRDSQSFVAEARQVLAEKVQLPAGMYIEFAGAAEQQRAATRELLVHGAMAAVGIVILLTVVLGNWRNLLLVLLNLPMALAGGVVAIYVTSFFSARHGDTLTMGAVVGFVTVFGITTRNSIMLVSHFERLVAHEGHAWDTATMIRGASERLVPILMTAAVTALGLLPLALGNGEAGREIEGPMAIVILGGLLTSTLLNLLVLPQLALRWARWDPVDREAGSSMARRDPLSEAP
ncbi:MAG TPA: efflux RND transporter permease subunit [Candidatus Binatia bacterium]|jgi:CzcA family heavy metal efflux pump